MEGRERRNTSSLFKPLRIGSCPLPKHNLEHPALHKGGAQIPLPVNLERTLLLLTTFSSHILHFLSVYLLSQRNEGKTFNFSNHNQRANGEAKACFLNQQALYPVCITVK